MFKKILVTGGSGFIGYHLHDYLAHERIVNLDLEEPDFEYRSTFLKGDVRDLKIVAEAIKGCDAVWNMAAAHKDFGISRDEYFDINEQGMRVITEAATAEGIKKFVFLSSVAVYGERNYGNMLRLMKQINKGQYVNIGEGSNIKSVAYVKNLVEAVLYLLDHLESGVSVYNYADEPQMTSHDIGKTIAVALGKSAPITLPYWLVYGLALPFDLIKKITGKDLAISSTRVQKLTIPTYFKAEKIRKKGFKPSFSNIEGLQNMAKWFNETGK